MRRPVQWRAPQQIDHRCFAGLNLRGCFGRLVFRRDDQIDIDPERVEVLRGPSGILYGGSAPGGLVNAVSKLPSAEPIRYI